MKTGSKKSLHISIAVSLFLIGPALHTPNITGMQQQSYVYDNKSIILISLASIASCSLIGYLGYKYFFTSSHQISIKDANNTTILPVPKIDSVVSGVIVKQYDASKHKTDIATMLDDESAEKLWDINATRDSKIDSVCRLLKPTTTWVACNNNTPVGFIDFYHTQKNNNDDGHIYFLYVNPKERGHGYAKTLVKHALETLFEKETCMQVTANTQRDNTLLQELSKKLNFTWNKNSNVYASSIRGSLSRTKYEEWKQTLNKEQCAQKITENLN